MIIVAHYSYNNKKIFICQSFVNGIHDNGIVSFHTAMNLNDKLFTKQGNLTT